jgi:hypothetical protein
MNSSISQIQISMESMVKTVEQCENTVSEKEEKVEEIRSKTLRKTMVRK